MEEVLNQSVEGLLPPIPDKRYFSISEVAELCGVKPHVLRFWENEFPTLKPKKRESRRFYTREDIIKVRQIRDLLYVQLFTIKGARVVLEGGGKTQMVPIALEPSSQKSRLFPFLGSRAHVAQTDFPEMVDGEQKKEEVEPAPFIQREWLQKELNSTLVLLRGGESPLEKSLAESDVHLEANPSDSATITHGSTKKLDF